MDPDRIIRIIELTVRTLAWVAIGLANALVAILLSYIVGRLPPHP